MMTKLYNKKNGSLVAFKYPARGTSNVLRMAGGEKIGSYTGPSGKGIIVREINGNYRRFSLSKACPA